MNLVVKARELKWAGKILQRGEPVQAVSDRDHRHLDLLLKIGKVEAAPVLEPLRQVSTMRPAPEPVVAETALEAPAPSVAPEPEAPPSEDPPAEPAPPPAPTPEDLPPSRRGYRRRDMTAED